MKPLRHLLVIVAAFVLAHPLPLAAQISPNSPWVNLPTTITFGGTATQTIKAGTCTAFAVSPTSGSAQLRVTISGSTYDFTVGDGWSLTSPNGLKFGNDVTLTALAGAFTISTLR